MVKQKEMNSRDRTYISKAIKQGRAGSQWRGLSGPSQCVPSSKITVEEDRLKYFTRGEIFELPT